ncbi:MAG: hypothetical protein H6621_07510 [Halobacteriovoraceae bacterium]|nr:hypothetical protein [Halobacteriovoraceae bacterium]
MKSLLLFSLVLSLSAFSQDKEEKVIYGKVKLPVQVTINDCPVENDDGYTGCDLAVDLLKEDVEIELDTEYTYAPAGKDEIIAKAGSVEKVLKLNENYKLVVNAHYATHSYDQGAESMSSVHFITEIKKNKAGILGVLKSKEKRFIINHNEILVPFAGEVPEVEGGAATSVLHLTDKKLGRRYDIFVSFADLDKN